MRSHKTTRIQNKLIKNLLFLIVCTVMVIDILMIVSLRRHYYKSTEENLINSIDASIKFYNKYFSKESLIENIYENVDSFWSNLNTQVEILDTNGKLIMDSLGIRDNKILSTPDIKKALSYGCGVWVGKLELYKGNAMIVSKTIQSNGEIIGIMRAIISLRNIDKSITYFIMLFLGISFVIVVISIIMCIIIARDITNPILKIINTANEMAKGNLDIKCEVNNNTEIDQLSKTLNYMAEEINNREKLKNQFISSVSHELRTPLTAIKGWAITLNDNSTDDETMNIGLGIIENEADRLSDMVEELLDFSKLIGGVTSINKVKCNINEFALEIENLMKARANREEKEFYVINNIKPSYVFIDVNRMKQVLINIIDNSFKFTELKGVITLKIERSKRGIIFIVEDNGYGISKEDLPRVKDKFYKGKNSKSKNGIGLSISDEIIKLHNGTLDIKSKLTEGTIITIEIPTFIEEV